LYIIYVTALGNIELQGKLFSYADDTALLISENNWEKAEQSAELDMYNINQWFLKHNLKLNFNKTKYITFSQDKKQVKIYMYLKF